MNKIVASTQLRLDAVSAGWFEDMTPAQKKAYIADHPNSKYAGKGGGKSKPAVKPSVQKERMRQASKEQRKRDDDSEDERQAERDSRKGPPKKKVPPKAKVSEHTTKMLKGASHSDSFKEVKKEVLKSLSDADKAALKKLHKSMSDKIDKVNGSKLSGDARGHALTKAQSEMSEWVADKLGLDKEDRKGKPGRYGDTRVKLLTDLAVAIRHELGFTDDDY